MNMVTRDYWRSPAHDWHDKLKHESVRPNCGGYKSAMAGKKELMRRWRKAGAVRLDNGIELVQRGIRQTVTFE